jgi:hypothetical protein
VQLGAPNLLFHSDDSQHDDIDDSNETEDGNIKNVCEP